MIYHSFLPQTALLKRPQKDPNANSDTNSSPFLPLHDRKTKAWKINAIHNHNQALILKINLGHSFIIAGTDLWRREESGGYFSSL